MPYPLGATVQDGGVNFSLYADRATGIDLLLFDGPDGVEPVQTIRLDPIYNRTFYYWHIFVPGVGAGQVYAYRADGPYFPDLGLRYDHSKVLVDPYARAITYGAYQRAAAARFGEDNIHHALKCVVVDPHDYDWEGDRPLRRPSSNAIIYEMHVRGFTRHPNSGVTPERAGTYAGLIEKIPHLQELGVTAVELMPVHQFDPQAAPNNLPNYWGYQPIAFFAPHHDYSSHRDPLGPVTEFRDMVKALHRAGIEVILDVVYNHTAEDNQNGPTLSCRGLENRTYYMLNSSRRAEYINYSGVGNTLNANNSIVRRLIADSLRYWVEHMHVDGFRFDLASVLSRGSDGRPLDDPPLLWEIESDPVLAGTRIIAEAWDAGGLYQVHNFVGKRWAVWNGQYRDTVRRFVKSDPGLTVGLADAIGGSPFLFRRLDRDPIRSINYITCHDGFTLNDLVSYNEKHNWANGEDNRDGSSDNHSWNCGAEGATGDAAVEALRRRQIKNLLTILLLSQGTPMLLMGDEMRRTQWGNNNAFDQDNELSWLDWGNLERHADVLRFTQTLLRFRRHSRLFHDRSFWITPGGTEIHWHGLALGWPDWGAESRVLAFELSNAAAAEHLHVMINAYWQPLNFELPSLTTGRTWHRLVDTALDSPYDISEPPFGPLLGAHHYRVQPRSVVVLIAAE
ncbi:MAG: glycogen debranching protein GlgX [Anaerolineae bacterium]|nr:glycogen debranching protein GlgX [Anaerolineae bacterium]